MSSKRASLSTALAIRPVIVSRVIPASPDMVFEAWTQPEQLMHWWSAGGLCTPECEIDLRPGGVFYYCMRSPDGTDYRCKGIYQEVSEPERLVFTNTFVNEARQLAHHPDLPDWPRETLVHVTFALHQEGTCITLQQAVSKANEAEAEGFERGREGAHEFWAMTLDCLAENLAHA
ncbi:SRPBCC domain-containing protein [Roseimicrobium sp. ORNL1]|uniref:SRPBCC family protein n=1 Tax=Roseimicrobium sp. ORNL1 TaxID=2711231 RepID=UPI0013E16A0E|nr:SRPBCC domain-containing protein [Roseimicrobium sp. ORNL1]QIF04706.1 SRPBCC domain-containing protein [Roseimicrobium sp. ORNL1]